MRLIFLPCSFVRDDIDYNGTTKGPATRCIGEIYDACSSATYQNERNDNKWALGLYSVVLRPLPSIRRGQDRLRMS